MKAATLVALVLSFSACHISYGGTIDVTPLDDDAGAQQNSRIAAPTPEEEAPVAETPNDEEKPVADAGDSQVVISDPVTTPDPVVTEDPAPTDAGQVADDTTEEQVDAGQQGPYSPPPANPKNRIIETPEQLAALAGMTETEGDLVLNMQTDSLEVLKDLQVVNGNLQIKYTNDTSLHLDNLIAVKGTVEILSNPNLTDLGMPKLGEITPGTLDGTAYRVVNNPKLSQCDVIQLFARWKPSSDSGMGNKPCQ